MIVYGIVTDPDNRPVMGASVSLSDPVTRQETIAETSPEGRYRLSVPAGVYRIGVAPPPGSGLREREVRELQVPPRRESYVLGEVLVCFRRPVVRWPAGLSSAPVREVTVTDPAVAEMIRQVRATRLEKVFPDAPESDTPAVARNGTLIEPPDLSKVYTLVVPSGADIPAVVEQFSGLPEVAYAEPNEPVRLFGQPLPAWVRLDLALEQGVGLDLFLVSEHQRRRTLSGVRPGDTLEVEIVALSGAGEAREFIARIEFDPKRLTYASLQTGGLIPGLQGFSFLGKGVVEIGGFTLNGGPGAVRDGGTLAFMRFQVGEDLPGIASLRLTSGGLKNGDHLKRFPLDRAVTAEIAGQPPADFDGSGEVDFDDFFLFADAFGRRNGDRGFEGKFDLDRNGEVGLGDLFRFEEAFGKEERTEEPANSLYPGITGSVR